MDKLDKDSVIGISALLVHAANIDEIYSDHEKDLIKDFIKSYLKNEDANEILKKADTYIFKGEKKKREKIIRYDKKENPFNKLLSLNIK